MDHSHHPTIPLHIQTPSAGRTGIIPLFRLCLSPLPNTDGLVLPFLKFLAVERGVPVYEGIMDLPVAACAESASEWSCRINISCTAGPTMYSLGVLACVYNHDTPPFPFLPPLLAGQPQAGPRRWFAEDVGVCLKCCFAIWGASAGRRCRRKKDWIWKQRKPLYLGKKRNSNPWWQTDAGWVLPVVTGSWSSK